MKGYIQRDPLCKLEFIKDMNMLQGITSISNVDTSIAILSAVVLQPIFSVLFLPCSIFTVMIGYCLPLYLSIPLSGVSTFLSIKITECVGERLFKSSFYVRNRDTRIVNKIEKMVKFCDQKAVNIILANTPGFPYSSFGYVFAMNRSNEKWRCAKAALFNMPSQIVFLGFGNSLSTGSIYSGMIFIALGILIYFKFKAKQAGAGNEQS